MYSLAENRKITEAGVAFRSHVDGSSHVFTPESVIDIQRQIGADIIMAFDECTPYPCEYGYALSSMELTHQWLTRCIRRMGETGAAYGYDQALFPIVQGSTYKDLRTRSAFAGARAGSVLTRSASARAERSRTTGSLAPRASIRPAATPQG